MARGAGGTNGGVGQFLLGVAMLCVGGFLLFNSIMVTSNFGMGSHLYGFSMMGSSINITTGMLLIPFIFGVGIIFYNSKNFIGWLLTLGTMAAMVAGVLSSVSFNLRPMSSFDLIIILVLSFGGLGLFLRSLKNFDE